MNGTPKDNSSRRQALKALGLLGSLGIYFAVVLGICIFIGNYVDNSFGTGNYGKLVGIIAGFPIAIYSTYKQLRTLFR